jgi:4-amino-4-deoxy-L-arabinose transferase-like glycosyltransferase
MLTAVSEGRLRWGDYLIVAFAGMILFGFALVSGRDLTGHEAVIPQTAREMDANHDWIVPRCGGTPWLERPPLSQWIEVAVFQLCGRSTTEWVFRLAPVLLSVGILLLVAGFAATWFGRRIGVVSALVLGTMWEFFSYGSNPEADIFLCAVVTGAVALFIHLEFGAPAEDERTGFVGARPWPMLGFFLLLGMTNLVKGLLFGTLMVLVPISGYLLLRGEFKRIRRYVWLWGWLLFAVVWLAWPVAAYLRYPDVTELWASDYLGRLNNNFVGEPTWYYAMALPCVLVPWTISSLIGLGATARRARYERSSPERFLWCWALLPPLFFSIPDGKHHHYLLQCLAPWGVLAALGATRFWQSVSHWPAWLRSPYLGLALFGVPLVLLVWVFRGDIPGPDWFVPALLIGSPIVVFGFCWAIAQRNGRVAAVTFFTLLIGVYVGFYEYQTRYLNSYLEEDAFLQEVSRRVPADEPLYVIFDGRGPLETFRMLFYGREPMVLLHNLTFLRDERITRPSIYLLARMENQRGLRRFGACEVVLTSPSMRHLPTPELRRALFRIDLDPNLERRSGDVPISPMQATWRALGPYLD